MNSQCTSALLMIRPASFGYNEETAGTNRFQKKPVNADLRSIQQKAITEFDAFVTKLKLAGVHVMVLNDTAEPPKPDAVFLNNWISFHEEGVVVFYPMYAENRRAERRNDLLQLLEEKYSFTFNTLLDLTYCEMQNLFLEGTGSLVLDRVNKIAYACISERTSPKLVEEFCMRLGYKSHLFHAVSNGVPVYHTNVVLSVCESFVVICDDYIPSETEKLALMESIKSTGKECIRITAGQAECFAGNMLQVHSIAGEVLLVMSTKAFHSLEEKQIRFFEQHSRIIHSALDTIELYGGGSARCMMAEVFLPKPHP